MDGKQAAIVVRNLFDAVRAVPPTFQLGDIHLDRGIWTIGCIVDGQTYNVQIGEYSGCIMGITKVKPSSMDVTSKISDDMKLRAQLETIVKAGMDDSTHRAMLAELEDQQCGPLETMREHEDCPRQRLIII